MKVSYSRLTRGRAKTEGEDVLFSSTSSSFELGELFEISSLSEQRKEGEQVSISLSRCRCTWRAITTDLLLPQPPPHSYGEEDHNGDHRTSDGSYRN